MLRFIIISFLLTGCIQYFDPSINQPEDQPIIIDALLTDESKNHEVRLSTAKYINESNPPQAIENADIYVENSEGEVYNYYHTKHGVYLSEYIFAGKSSVDYRIVVTIDSEQYVSDFESMPAPAELLDIKTNLVYEVTEKKPGVFSNEPRMEFTVDVERVNELDDSYFRFDWEATYRVETTNQGDSICWTERGQEPPEDLKFETCYATDNPEDFLRVFSTEGVTHGQTIRDIPVYLTSPNKKFQFRYSPEITMYTISKSAYDFWEQIVNQNENSGGLFDPPLGPIVGNIYGQSEASDRIIGIFEVASVVKRRAFFLRSDVTIEMRDYETDCIIPPRVVNSSGLVMYFPRPFYCCDCTLLANCTNVKPDFW